MCKHRPVFLLSYFLILLPVLVGAEEKTITLGGAEGWSPLAVSDGLTRGTGRLGYEALVLDTRIKQNISGISGSQISSAYIPGEDSATDLYLSFDKTPFSDGAGRYTVVSIASRLAETDTAMRGSGALLCSTNGNGLSLHGESGSLFASSGVTGSFCIEFWLSPAVVEDGSVIFQWRSSLNDRSGARYQSIRADFLKNHLEWIFSGIWTTAAGEPVDISVSGKRNLIPGMWAHHLLSYDAESGLLEYRLDGVAEDIRYVTSTGQEEGDIYSPVLGRSADPEIVPQFSGLIDEFYIKRKAVTLETVEAKHAVLDRYSGLGRFESVPIDSGGKASILKRISVEKTEPSGTGTDFYVRAGDNPYSFTDDDPVWVAVDPDATISGVTGAYFQIAGNLYPDGAGTVTPSVTSVTLHYEADTPPWPPVQVFASAGDGSVTLEWPASIDADTTGYLVYYGDRPGEYLCAGSPIDAGDVRTCTITGLKNGKMYYFCVAAYDTSGPKYPGQLSSEAFARPRIAR